MHSLCKVTEGAQMAIVPYHSGFHRKWSWADERHFCVYSENKEVLASDSMKRECQFQHIFNRKRQWDSAESSVWVGQIFLLKIEKFSYPARCNGEGPDIESCAGTSGWTDCWNVREEERSQRRHSWRLKDIILWRMNVEHFSGWKCETWQR